MLVGLAGQALGGAGVLTVAPSRRNYFGGHPNSGGVTNACLPVFPRMSLSQARASLVCRLFVLNVLAPAFLLLTASFASAFCFVPTSFQAAATTHIFPSHLSITGISDRSRRRHHREQHHHGFRSLRQPSIRRPIATTGATVIAPERS